MSLVKKLLRILAMAAAFLGLLNCGLPLPDGADQVSQTALRWGERVIQPARKQLLINYSPAPNWTVPRPLFPAAGTGRHLFWDRINRSGEAMTIAGGNRSGSGRAVLKTGELMKVLTIGGVSPAVTEYVRIWPRGQP